MSHFWQVRAERREGPACKEGAVADCHEVQLRCQFGVQWGQAHIQRHWWQGRPELALYKKHI